MSALKILENMKDKRILVVGDAMDDIYHFGSVSRICPEAPVPVFVPERTETRAGGAGNVVAQLKDLGCMVRVSYPPRRSRKTRFMVGSHLLMRMDEDYYNTPSDEDIDLAARLAGDSDVTVISDYAKGWVSEDMCRAVTKAGVTIVDPKGTLWTKYRGCALICPNDQEYLSYANQNQTFNILWKRGALGMRLLPEGTDIPAHARRVYDVTGAGDTVVAVVAAAVAAGASYLEAAQIAALAAGYVVGEVGTTTCPLERLKELVNAG